MNKNDLISAVCADCDIKKNMASCVVNSVFSSIEKALLRGENVLISGFGKFWVKYCPATVKVLPKTKFKHAVSPKFSPKFSATRAFKQQFCLKID